MGRKKLVRAIAPNPSFEGLFVTLAGVRCAIEYTHLTPAFLERAGAKDRVGAKKGYLAVKIER